MHFKELKDLEVNHGKIQTGKTPLVMKILNSELRGERPECKSFQLKQFESP